MLDPACHLAYNPVMPDKSPYTHPVRILPPPRPLKDIRDNPLPDSGRKTSSIAVIALGVIALIAIVAVPGFIVASRTSGSSLPDPAAGTALERKVSNDLEREQAARQRAAAETVERIRQQP